MGGMHSRLVSGFRGPQYLVALWNDQFFMTKHQFLDGLGKELGVPSDKLVNDAALASLGPWDSMTIMAVVAFLDSELNFSAPQGALQRCETVGEIIALVADRFEP